MKASEAEAALASMPPGLTFDELAARLSCERTTAYKWAKRFGYALGNGVSLHWNRKRVESGLEKEWAAIDWRQSDAKIARQLKRSRQWVFQLRRKRTDIRLPKRRKNIKPPLDRKEAA